MFVLGCALVGMAQDGTNAYNFLSVPVSSHVYAVGGHNITIIDDDGQEFELEVLDEMQYNGETYVAFLPADMKEDDPDYGIIILRSVEDENGDELFESIDDEDQLNDVYEHFMVLLFDDEEDGE